MSEKEIDYVAKELMKRQIDLILMKSGEYLDEIKKQFREIKDLVPEDEITLTFNLEVIGNDIFQILGRAKRNKRSLDNLYMSDKSIENEQIATNEDNE